MKVTPAKLETWINDDKIVDQELKDRRIFMRLGKIENSVPFGIATYQTDDRGVEGGDQAGAMRCGGVPGHSKPSGGPSRSIPWASNSRCSDFICPPRKSC